MDPVVAVYVAAIFVSVAIVVVTVVVGVAMRNHYDYAREDLELKRKALELKAQDKHGSLEYSKDMIEFIRMMVAQQALLKYKEFVDKHKQIDKITEANVKNLVEEVANSAHQAINHANIMFSDTIFTRDFYNHYIVETSMMYVKELIKKLIGDNIDDFI